MHAGLGCDVSWLRFACLRNIPDLESCYLHDMVLHSDGHSSALWTTFGPKWCGNLWKWSMAAGPALSSNVIGELRCGSSCRLSRCRRNGRSRSANQGYPSCRRSRRSDGLATTIRRRHACEGILLNGTIHCKDVVLWQIRLN